MNYLLFNYLIINFTSMKKAFKFMFAAIILVALGTSAFAQVSANATVTTNVLSALSATKNTDVAFGAVISGVNPDINPVTGVKTSTGATAVAGKFTVTGSVASNVQVTFSNPIAIPRTVGAGAPANLRYVPSVSRRAGVTGVDLFGGVAYASGTTYAIDASGSDVFFIGGTLSDAGAVIPGTAVGNTYSGTFTLTATYN
jgi:hypothetical protein